MTNSQEGYQEEKLQQLVKLLSLLWQERRLCLGTPSSGELLFINLEPITKPPASLQKKANFSDKEQLLENLQADELEEDSQEAHNIQDEIESVPLVHSPNDGNLLKRYADTPQISVIPRNLTINYDRAMEFMRSYCKLDKLEIIKSSLLGNTYENKRSNTLVDTDDEYFRLKEEGIEKIIASCLYGRNSINKLVDFLEDKHDEFEIPSIQNFFFDRNEELFPDVFISYNTKDHTFVHEVARQLSERGIEVWIDERDLAPGDHWFRTFERVLPHVRAAAIFFGINGRGQWHTKEIDAFQYEQDSRERKGKRLNIIPVILKNCSQEDTLIPPFLQPIANIDCSNRPDYIDRLVHGITRIKSP